MAWMSAYPRDDVAAGYCDHETRISVNNVFQLVLGTSKATHVVDPTGAERIIFESQTLRSPNEKHKYRDETPFPEAGKVYDEIDGEHRACSMSCPETTILELPNISEISCESSSETVSGRMGVLTAVMLYQYTYWEWVMDRPEDHHIGDYANGGINLRDWSKLGADTTYNANRYLLLVLQAYWEKDCDRTFAPLCSIAEDRECLPTCIAGCQHNYRSDWV